jgi:DNA primase
MREPEDPAGRPYDLFFNRVMFPIRDRRGHVISFGGRTLGDGQPKYVNGPETPLFSKRRNLYALDLAREAARKGEPVVVVEGYMDVIALHQAGFAGAVAPLGTALTPEQLGELWRLSPQPVLCFDGDAAGAKAAARAADGALELLASDRTLKLATVPPGEDPDTLVRREGPAGFQVILDTARPLADALYDLLRHGDETTPEQRAAFRARLEAAAKRIPDKSLAGDYAPSPRVPASPLPPHPPSASAS